MCVLFMRTGVLLLTVCVSFLAHWKPPWERTVWFGINTVDGHTIAIKRICLEGHSEDEISKLMREVKVLKRLDHPGIVKYLGMQRKWDNLNEW